MDNQHPSPNQAISQNKNELKAEIEAFARVYTQRHRINFGVSAMIILLGLLLGASVTLAGMFNQGFITAILGVCIAFLIGLQNAFPLGEKAEFYRLIVAESQNLLDDLKFGTKTEVQFLTVLKKFAAIRMYAAMNLPRGQGMEAVKNMYKELNTVSSGNIAPIAKTED